MQSQIAGVYRINDPASFFKKNENLMYISFTIGFRDLKIEEDDIGTQLQRVQLNHKFNINETICFRTFFSCVAFVYYPMLDKLFGIHFKVPIVNIKVVLDNSVVFILEKKQVEFVSFRSLESKCYLIDHLNDDKLFQTGLTFMGDRNKKKVSLKFDFIDLNHGYFVEPKHVCQSTPRILSERCWAVFRLQTKNSMTLSKFINGAPSFIYKIHFDQNEERYFTLSKLIQFLQDEFYQPIRVISFNY